MAAHQSVRTDDSLVTYCSPESPNQHADSHRMRVVGYLRGPGPAGLDCQSPLQVVCRDCDRRDAWPCKGHRSSVCGPCAARYRRRVQAVAFSGMRRGAGYLYLLTLTAPGVRQHRMPSGDWCPCTPPGGVELGEWNASHSKRWNHFRTAMRREYPDVQFMRGVEVQTRGALHDHALIWSPAPLSKSYLKALAMRAGFGHSLDLAVCEPGSKRAAYYVSKYVTKATDSREQVPWVIDQVDQETGVVDRLEVAGRYRTWSCSREWGMTMAQARAEAAAYASTIRARGPVPNGETSPTGDDSGTTPLPTPSLAQPD